MKYTKLFRLLRITDDAIMKTDTLTGPNLSYHVAVLDDRPCVRIDGDVCYICGDLENSELEFDYRDAEIVRMIAEREWIGVEPLDTDDEIIVWKAKCRNRKQVDGEKFKPVVTAYGSTMAEAMMRCYVKSYLGDDTKGECNGY